MREWIGRMIAKWMKKDDKDGGREMKERSETVKRMKRNKMKEEKNDVKWKDEEERMRGMVGEEVKKVRRRKEVEEKKSDER